MDDLSPSPTTYRLDGQTSQSYDANANATAGLREELATARTQIKHLEHALVSNRRIGAAVGILMYRHKITYEQGFELLRVASQDGHQKLHDIAEAVIDTGQLNLPHGPDRAHSDGESSHLRVEQQETARELTACPQGLDDAKPLAGRAAFRPYQVLTF